MLRAITVTENKMKPYLAKYYYFYYYTEQRVCIIVQGSASAALGEALMKYPDTSAEHWSIEEITLDDRSIVEIDEAREGC
jgi:hypothetical protein